MESSTLVVCLGFLAAASLWDLRAGRIPGWLNAAGASMGIVLQGAHFEWATGFDRGVLWGTLGWFACAAVPFLLWRSGDSNGQRLLGGGDVLLLGAVGAFFGVREGLGIVLTSFVVGAVLWMALLSWRGELFATLWALVRRWRPTSVEAGSLPFAPVVLLGTLVASRDAWVPYIAP